MLWYLMFETVTRMCDSLMFAIYIILSPETLEKISYLHHIKNKRWSMDIFFSLCVLYVHIEMLFHSEEAPFL